MKIHTIKSTITHLLKTTNEQQKLSLRYLTRAPIESKISIMQNMRDIFYKLKQNNKEIELPILSYAALVLAIDKYQNNTDLLDKNVIELKSKKLKKQPKKERLLSYWALIKSLRNEKKLSFREIATYLKKYHKFEVVHSTIYNLWVELKSTKEIKK